MFKRRKRSTAEKILRSTFAPKKKSKKAKRRPTAKKPQHVGVPVQVAFQELTQPMERSPGWGYTYLWALEQPPFVGARVKVPGFDGQANAVVIALGASPESEGMKLKRVSRLVTNDEIDSAFRKLQTDLKSWLKMARRAAGLPTPGKPRALPPKNYPHIAPVTGDAHADDANEYGRMWFRAFKSAEELGYPDDEIKAYRDIAYRWFAIRDQT